MLIDSHCHLDRFATRGDFPAVLERSLAAGVTEVITIGTNASDWPVYAEMALKHKGVVHWAAGLHPCDVEEDWEDQLAQLPSWFAETVPPCALGECGLDYFHLPKDADEAAKSKARQHEAFKIQLELALQFNCPVVVHSRHAFADCLRLIDASGVDWRKVIFHCFSEGAEEMRQLKERGGHASFTGILTYKSAASIREAALLQGLDRFQLETDAPFLTPEPHRGKPNEPALMRHTAEYAARLFNVTLEELAATATRNTRSFFSLPAGR